MTRLDLDDVRTVVGEHPRRVRPGEHPREVEHDDVVERAAPGSWPVPGRLGPGDPGLPRCRGSGRAGRRGAPHRVTAPDRRHHVEAGVAVEGDGHERAPGQELRAGRHLLQGEHRCPRQPAALGLVEERLPWQCPGERLDDGEDVVTVLGQSGRVTHQRRCGGQPCWPVSSIQSSRPAHMRGLPPSPPATHPSAAANSR